MIHVNSSFKSVHILLIEDNPGDVLLAKEVFSDSKIKNSLSVVCDGEEAMDYLFKANGFQDAETPDLILLDLNLPKKDGYEVLSELKQNEKFKSISVIVMISSEAERDRISTYNLQADGYVIKPLDLEQFSRIFKALDHFWISLFKSDSTTDKEMSA